MKANEVAELLTTAWPARGSPDHCHHHPVEITPPTPAERAGSTIGKAAMEDDSETEWHSLRPIRSTNGQDSNIRKRTTKKNGIKSPTDEPWTGKDPRTGARLGRAWGGKGFSLRWPRLWMVKRARHRRAESQDPLRGNGEARKPARTKPNAFRRTLILYNILVCPFIVRLKQMS